MGSFKIFLNAVNVSNSINNYLAICMESLEEFVENEKNRYKILIKIKHSCFIFSCFNDFFIVKIFIYMGGICKKPKYLTEIWVGSSETSIDYNLGK